jgi:hypothetical protein
MAKPKCRCPEDWNDWADWLAAGLHGRNRWRLAIVLFGMLFADGRRCVTAWLRAAAVSHGFQGYYYFIGSTVGRNIKTIATRLFVLLLQNIPIKGNVVLLAIDDSPTKRYGPKIEGAGIHHNPTPGPVDAKFLYGHVWTTIAWVIRHPLWGTIGLPLLALLYIRRKDLAKIPPHYKWTFHTKLQQGVELALWAKNLVKQAGKSLRIVADGAYAKRPFLRPLIEAGIVVVSRLRKDAALRDLPPKLKKGQPRPRGRPRKYGKNKISLAKRAGHRQGWKTVECVQYGEVVEKKYKTFLATYRPAGVVIRVAIVKEPDGHDTFFSTDPDMSVREILETFSDRAAIEQDFHDVKEVWGAGQQQLRNIWANLGAWNLNLWIHSLVELWAWRRPMREISDRTASPWDDPSRRPSHADRRKALRRKMIALEFSSIHGRGPIPRKILQLAKWLAMLAT